MCLMLWAFGALALMFRLSDVDVEGFELKKLKASRLHASGPQTG